jgi:hypothetical protein
MSDEPEGPGWWIASDGKWYPPELHPSVREDTRAHASTAGPGTAQPPKWQSQADREKEGHVGPRFPDLFQKALQGSHLADNISVKYDGDDERNVTKPVSGPANGSMTTVKSNRGSPVTAGAVGVTIGAPAPAKRKWRKGR